MRVLFVLDRRLDAGSIQAVNSYLAAGDALGHRMAVLGFPDERFMDVRTSTDLGAFDHVVFIFESTLKWLGGLKLSYLLERVERERRAIIDADGMYNERICLGGYDRNHADQKQQILWRQYYEALSERIFQPTRRPLSAKVAPLLFYGYQHLSLTNQNHTPKKWDLVHVGHNWWRWKQIRETLIPALEQIRRRLNGVGFVGSWWDRPPSWASQIGLEEAFHSDHRLMERLLVQIEPAVPYRDVIATMSQGRINIMTQRPLFQHLRFVTSKYFEIFCADTIPLVMLPPDQAEEIYGSAGREIALHDNVAEKLMDVLDHMDTYRDVVREIRRHLEIHHSYHRRIEELVEALESRKASLAVRKVVGS